MLFTSTHQSSTNILQRDIQQLIDKLNKDIHNIEKTSKDDEIVVYASPGVAGSATTTVYDFESKLNKDYSPCKLKYVPFILFGNTISSYECAPKTEQLNKIPNMECATIRRIKRLSLTDTNGKINIVRVAFGVGCELRFEKHLNHFNKLKPPAYLTNSTLPQSNSTTI